MANSFRAIHARAGWHFSTPKLAWIYGAKAISVAGVPIDPDVAVGAAVPLVLWSVWRMTRRIHRALQKNQ